MVDAIFEPFVGATASLKEVVRYFFPCQWMCKKNTRYSPALSFRECHSFLALTPLPPTPAEIVFWANMKSGTGSEISVDTAIKFSLSLSVALCGHHRHLSELRARGRSAAFDKVGGRDNRGTAKQLLARVGCCKSGMIREFADAGLCLSTDIDQLTSCTQRAMSKQRAERTRQR